MSELWALLHFIMPNLFDSHEQFQEWFSKDIEAHSQDKGELNQEQLKRLHKISFKQFRMITNFSKLHN